ncbi:MAG: YdeI/OmpD-associated family protein [Ignavibacteriaceae bacterium]
MEKIKFFKEPKDFRQWLEQNHTKYNELWVGYYKKSSGKRSIDWPQSVDQALCFGWIDGLRKSIDEESYKIRFSPRKSGSIWSAVNLKRAEELIELGLMQPAGLEAFKNKDEKKINRYSFERENVKLDKEYEKKFKSNKKAWDFFQSMVPSYRKPSLWWLMSAKQEETRLKRLNILISCSEAGEKIPQMKWADKSKKLK